MKVDIDKHARGTYILLIELPRGVHLKVGARGILAFPQGFYAYCGSAMGGIGARINRHLRREKKIRWHVDYLLEKGRVKRVIYAPTHERLECQLAQRLGEVFHSFPGFGSSDCHCPSHLLFSEELQSLQEKAEKGFKGLVKGAEDV